MLELLAPVGNKESFYQAINNGANAVYLAGKKFGARAFADNFDIDELKDMVIEAHSLGVKVYVTVNTLIKDEEFSECIRFIKFLNEINVDAIIMQDIGLIRYVRELIPDMSIHASTNMSCNCVNKAVELSELGVKRIILAREVSINDVQEIIDKSGLEVEMFGHGALCMCYSGKCLLSSSIGKRSGNRGTCAQPCRMEYKLKKDDEILKRKFYLSPKDLCTIDKIDEFKKNNVCSIKLEGRMKRSEYVGVITRSYRKAIDNKLSDKELDELKNDMSLMFNRGFTKGYIFGADNKHFTNVGSSNHIGVKVGEVIKYHNHIAFIKLISGVCSGDGLRFVGKVSDAIIINEMYVNGIKKWDASANDVIQVRCHNDIEIGTIVLKTSDAKLIQNINETPEKKIPIVGSLYYNGKVTFEVSDGMYIGVAVTDVPYVKAEKKETVNRIKEQLLKSNDTHYYFKAITMKDDIFLPIKDANDLRRRAIEALDHLRSQRTPHPVNDKLIDYSNIKVKKQNEIYFECKNNEQIDACLSNGCKVIVRDNKLKNIYKEQVLYIEPRINNIFYSSKFIDCYENVLNSESVYYYARKGANVIGISVEASKKNILAIIKECEKKFGVPNLMVTLYGRQELMVMKHCLICKEMGYDSKGCGECLNHNYFLIDKMGEEYPLHSDGSCNLVLYNSKVTNLINKKHELEDMGIHNFMVTFSFESKDEVERIIQALKENKDIHFDKETTLYYSEDII